MIISKEMGFHRTVFTQAGCSFLFLLPADHKDISCRLHRGAPESGQKKYYNDRFYYFYRHILEGQTAHQIDTIHTSHLFYASVLYSLNILYLKQSESVRGFANIFF